MTVAPISSTIVSVGLIPVAFLFIHAFFSGRKTGKFHPVSGFIAIVWDLTMSIGYMLYRTFGGAIEGETLQLNSAFNTYFMVHGLVAAFVMSLEIVVLSFGLRQVQTKRKIAWHGKLAKILFSIWWIAFFSGEIFYLVMYVF